MPPEAWQRVVRYTAGQEPRADVIVPSRLAEVLIHHVDLDVGFGTPEWPSAFVDDILPRIAGSLHDRGQVAAMHLAGLGTSRILAIGASGSPGIIVSGQEHGHW